MAIGSAVVGSLRVILGLDAADFTLGSKQATDAAKNLTRELKVWGTQATQIGSALTRTLTLPLAGLAAGVASVGIGFEKSFANVRKTVNGSEEQFKALSNSLRDLAKTMPFTTDELTKIASLGGQMGVSVDTLADFTKNVAALGVAVDGISTEEAATGLAQIGNVAGIGTTKTAEMASALVHLGNNSVSTEGQILEFTKRLIGAGSAVGMTVPEVMALGTAMADVGINAEAGGTAMSTVLTKMSKAVSSGGDDLKAFAEIAGKSASDFAAAFKSNPVVAVDLFIKGLHRMKTEGKDLNLTMGEIGADGARISMTLKNLAGAANGVGENLKTSNEGWRDADKHMIEADKKAATTAAQLTVLWSKIKDVGIVLFDGFKPAIEAAIGLVTRIIPLVEGMAKAFVDLPRSVQLVGLGFLAVVAAAGPALVLLGQLATAAASVTGAFAAKGIATKLLGDKVVVLTGAMTLLGRAMAVTGAAFGGWAIGTWISGLGGLGDAAETASQRIKRLGTDALTIGEKVEASFVGLMDALSGKGFSKQHNDEILTAIVSRRMAAEHAASAASNLGQAEETAAVRSKAAQDSLKKSTEDLALQLGNLKKSGDPAVESLEMLGLQASEAKKHARLLGVDLGTLPPTVLALADAYDKAHTKIVPATKSLEEQKAALKDAEDAAKAEQKAIDDLNDSVHQFGLITERDMNEELGKMQTGFAGAMAAGMGLTRTLPPFVDNLQALIVKARRSGLDVSYLVSMLEALRQEMKMTNPIVPLDISTGAFDFSKISKNYDLLSIEAVHAKLDADELTEAYHSFGMKTPEEMAKAARAAREHYNTLAASGTATKEQLEDAWDDLLKAEGKQRKDSYALWKQWGKQIIGIGQDTLRAFVSSLMGMSGQTAQEHQRAAEDAKDAYEETSERAQETFEDTVLSAQESYNDQVVAANDAYDEIVSNGEDSYQRLLASGTATEEELTAAKKALYIQAQEAAKERDRKIAESNQKMLDEIKAAEAKAQGEMETAHQEMLDAQEAASHRWKDNLIDIWRDLKSAFAGVINEMLSAFIERFIGGALAALFGSRGSFASAFAGLFNFGGGGGGGLVGGLVGGGGAASGVPSITAYGGAAGYGGGASVGGVTAGTIAGGALSGVAFMELLAPGFFKQVFTDFWGQEGDKTLENILSGMSYSGISDPYEYGRMNGISEDVISALVGQGGIPGYAMGTMGQYVDFGAGTLAMLHGREKITPEGAAIDSAAWGGGAMTVQLIQDGRKTAQWLVPYIPEEVFRLELA